MNVKHTIIEDENLIGWTFHCSTRKRNEKFIIKKVYKDNRDVLCVEASDADGGALYTFPVNTCRLDKPRYKLRKKRRKKRKKKNET
jgi:hypothetical protein